MLKETLSFEDDLDQLAFRILDLMTQHINHKKTIENYVRSGCLDLAKARYITSNRNISSLQLPTEDAVGISASFRVIASKNEDHVSFEKYDSDMVSCIDSLKKVNLEEADSKNDEKCFSNEPLKWFGVLVPQSLKQSKKTFQNCLEIVIECANVQLELERCLEKYQIIRKNLQKHE